MSMSNGKKQSLHLKATTHEVEIGILVPDRTVNLSSDGNYVIFEDTQNWIGPLNRYKKHLLLMAN